MWYTTYSKISWHLILDQRTLICGKQLFSLNETFWRNLMNEIWQDWDGQGQQGDNINDNIGMTWGWHRRLMDYTGMTWGQHSDDVYGRHVNPDVVPNVVPVLSNLSPSFPCRPQFVPIAHDIGNYNSTTWSILASFLFFCNNWCCTNKRMALCID